MLDANPNLTLAQVRDILHATAQDWGPTGQDVDYGWGRLDGWAAVKRAGNYTGGTAPAVPGHVTFTGTLSTGSAFHTFNVTDASMPVSVTMIMPGWTGSSSPDFDLYVFNPDGSELGRSTSTTRQEQVAKRVTQTGTYKVEVRQYGGSGDYVIDVSAGTGAPTDQPPTVAIDQPAEGATVSGTTTVKVRAADDNRVSKVELAVDGGAYTDITAGFDGTFYTYAWNTAGVANGAHTLTARATDSANQQATATRNLTVSNQAPPPPPPTLSQTLTKTGRVTSGARDATFSISVHDPGFLDLVLSWPTGADLDFYVTGPDGKEVGRAYTVNNPERLRIDTVRYGAGTYQVRVNLYAGPDSDFTLTASGYKQELFQGTVSSTARNSTVQRAIGYTGRGRAILSWPGSSDLDFYVYDPSGKERGRAYTLNNPEQLDTVIDATGTWSIRVNLYSGAAVQYTLKWIVPEAVLQ